MRYTTVIDISEIPEIYRNKNVSRLYFHLCLKAGYHDDDRDVIRLSVRGMTYGTGLSLSATRNAISQLMKHGLLEKTKDGMKVKKFLVEMPVSKRARTRKEIDPGKAVQKALEEESHSRLKAGEKTSWMQLYEYKMRQAKAGDKAAQQFVRDHAQQYKEQSEMIKKELENYDT